MIKNKKIAFMYDFDETLSYDYMQNYSLLPYLGCNPIDFWEDVNVFGLKHNMDSVLACMYKYLEVARQKQLPLTKEIFMKMGDNIKYYKGVTEWFERITAFGKTLGLDIEHYIISSGQAEIIEGSKIAHNFKKIFACRYCFDENSVPFWPSLAINYTNKTQFIYRIRKDLVDNLYESKSVNAYSDSLTKLPYNNMVYFGDGLTDIPCMKLLKGNGGTSVCVYNPESESAKIIGEQICNVGRTNYVAPADYSENSELDIIIKKHLEKLAKEI